MLNLNTLVDGIIMDRLEKANREGGDRTLGAVEFSKILNTVQADDTLRTLCEVVENATGETTRVGLSEVRAAIARLAKPKVEKSDGIKTVVREALLVVDPTAERGKPRAATVEEFERWDSLTLDDDDSTTLEGEQARTEWAIARVSARIEDTQDRWLALRLNKALARFVDFSEMES